MTYVTTVSAVMRSVPPDRLGVASGIANTIRQVGAVLGVAVGIAVFSSYGGFQSPEQFIDGFTPAVLTLAVITLLGIVPALAIRKMDSGPDDGNPLAVRVGVRGLIRSATPAGRCRFLIQRPFGQHVPSHPLSWKGRPVMADKPAPIPDTYRRVTPALIVKGADAAIKFYADLFGATERMRFPGPDGTVAHAEIEIGDSVVIVEDEFPYRGTKAPPAGGLEGTPVFQFIYVEDVDATLEKAVKLGATLQRRRGDPVLRRPRRLHHRPVRPRLDDRLARGGRQRRAAHGAHGRDDGRLDPDELPVGPGPTCGTLRATAGGRLIRPPRGGPLLRPRNAGHSESQVLKPPSTRIPERFEQSARKLASQPDGIRSRRD